MMFNAALGIILSVISGAVTTIIDGIITSQYLGSNALAATGLSGISFSILGVISGVIATGSQQFYSNELVDASANKKGNSFAKVITFTFAVSMVVMLVCIAASGVMASAVGAPPHMGELHQLVKNYMIGIFLGAPALILVPVLIPAAQLNGDNRIITLSIIVLIAGDVIGDLMNVLIFHGGMLGMGIASSFSYYLSLMVLACSFLKKESLFKIEIKVPDLGLIRKIIKTGVPMASRYICNCIRPLFINNLVMIAGGSVALAAFAVQQNVRYFTESIGIGIAGAAYILIGLFLCEQDPDSLRWTSKASVRFIAAGIGSFAVIYFLAAPMLAKIYLPEETASFELAVLFLRCHAIGLPFLAFNEYYFNVTQASNRIKLSNLITILNKLVYVVVASAVLYVMVGTFGLLVAIPVSEVLLTLTILVGTAVTNRNNPNRATRLSFLDDKTNAESKQLEISIKSTEDLELSQQRIAEFCKENGFSKKSSYMIQLFFEEISMLTIQHGFDSKKDYFIDIRVLCTDDDIVLRTKDNCKAFTYNERQLMYGHYDDDDYMGINMVTKLAKDVKYVHIMNVNNFIVVI